METQCCNVFGQLVFLCLQLVVENLLVLVLVGRPRGVNRVGLERNSGVAIATNENGSGTALPREIGSLVDGKPPAVPSFVKAKKPLTTAPIKIKIRLKGRIAYKNNFISLTLSARSFFFFKSKY
jgi:hypothetical protein